MPTTYHLIDAPRFSEMAEHDCRRCDAESLKRPVWLSSPETGAQAFGSRCAAILLGLIPETANAAEGRTAISRAVKAKAEAERIERQAAARAEDEAYSAWLFDTYGIRWGFARWGKDQDDLTTAAKALGMSPLKLHAEWKASVAA